MPVLAPTAMRSFTGNTKVLDEKEKGDERLYFKRQEGMLPILFMILNSVNLFNNIEERLRKLQQNLQKQGFEQVPSEVQRAQETLTLIFKQFDLDPIANKALYDTLIDWKRTI